MSPKRRSRSSWILDTMVTPAKVSVKRPRHSKLCRGHQEEAVRLTVAPLLESFDVSQIGRTVVTSTLPDKILIKKDVGEKELRNR